MNVQETFSNIYVSMVDISLQYFHLLCIWDIWMTLYVIFSTTLFKNIVMKIQEIYFGITWYIFWETNIHWWREIRQCSTLALPVFNEISSYTYKVEILTALILSDKLYITLPLSWEILKVIANIQCYVFTSKTTLHKKYFQGILPTFMWVSLVVLYSFGSWFMYTIYIWHYMLAFSPIYPTISWWKVPKFML